MTARPLHHLLLLALASACDTAPPGNSDAGGFALGPGSGQVTWVDSVGHPDRPVTLRYHVPDGFGPESPIVIVMHGASRDGPRYFADWEPEARAHGFLLLVPEFSAALYPGSEMYNLGNMFETESGGGPRPEDAWTFTALERLFADVRRVTGSTRDRFRLYGHSAGGQFVHRFLFFRPDAPVERAVAANAGWYTLPVDTVAFPYGLAGSGRTQADITRSWGTPTTILLGDQDVDSLQSNLRRTPEALRQGPHRFARGHAFYGILTSEADRLGIDLAWTLDTVPGAHHSDALMAPRAAEILAAPPR